MKLSRPITYYIHNVAGIIAMLDVSYGENEHGQYPLKRAFTECSHSTTYAAIFGLLKGWLYKRGICPHTGIYYTSQSDTKAKHALCNNTMNTRKTFATRTTASTPGGYGSQVNTVGDDWQVSLTNLAVTQVLICERRLYASLL